MPCCRRSNLVAGGLVVCLLAACVTRLESPPEEPVGPVSYDGIETRLLDDDLVNFRAQMTNATALSEVDAYARCAAAQYTLIRGYAFARHVRTSIVEEGGVWVADAVYTISPELPRGLQTLEAEVVTADCIEQGIPTV